MTSGIINQALVATYTARSVTIGRTDNYTQTGPETGTSSFSQAGVSFGTADSDRLVIACVFAASRAGTFSSGAIASVTIGGVSASRADDVLFIVQQGEISLWYAVVSTGTTGTIVVNMIDKAMILNVHVFAAYGDTSAPFTTTSDGPVSDTSVSGSFDLSQNTLPGVSLVGMLGEHFIGNNQNGATLSWPSGLSDDLETTVQLSTAAGLLRARLSTAYASDVPTGATPRTITGAWGTPTTSSGTPFISTGGVCSQLRVI